MPYQMTQADVHTADALSECARIAKDCNRTKIRRHCLELIGRIYSGEWDPEMDVEFCHEMAEWLTPGEADLPLHAALTSIE